MALETEPAKERVVVRADRMLWAAPLTLAVSLIAVLLIRLAAVALVKPPADFLPLTLEPPILDTIVFGGAAIFVFYLMGWYSLEPVRDYRRLAWKALLVSFIPDFALAIRHGFGGGWPEALALMGMHVAVWAACVTMLPMLAASNPAPGGELPRSQPDA